jgi:hypothetical protein
MQKNLAMSLCWAVSLFVRAQEVGYLETFSLADDREAALRELVPGSDDDYYYRALQAQNTGKRGRFAEVLQTWRNARDGQLPESGRELEYRQALLGYNLLPKDTLDLLTLWLDLRFNHARKTERVSTAPTVLDDAVLGRDALLAFASTPWGDNHFTEAGLAFIAGTPLGIDERGYVLAHLRRPDIANLVELIVADMKTVRRPRTFGSLPIHTRLTLAQLDDLARQMPEVRNVSPFVNTYLAKLAPEDEADPANDSAVREAYLERLWTFAQTLDPVHNSLKASVLYNRLRHDLTKGAFDRDRFLEYIKLPRHVPYLARGFRERIASGNANPYAKLNQDFNLAALPPVPQDEPLVRRFLLAFLKDADDTRAFEPYLDADFLKALFAEAKIVNGIGEPQQWAPLLAPEAYRRLKERVDIDFAEDNPAVVGVDEAVRLTVFLKNVPSLLVKVYEINTFNYYRESGRALDLAVNLDGLVASFERRVTLGEPPERRVARTFDFPEIKGRGVYVIEWIGNGKSSRALVQKGRLNVVQEVTTAGHAFTVFDEAGRRVTDAAGWSGGREFASGKDGRILVPFSTAPRNERMVIRQGTFAALVTFGHLAETYSLEAGVYVDREALIRREKAQVAVRPALRVNGQPASLKLLEEVRLSVKSVDRQGIATAKEFAGLALREDAETVQEIQVPEDAVSLSVALHARVQNLSLNQKQELSDAAAFGLNGIDQSGQTRAFHAGVSADGYYAELRGKNGETLAGEPVRAALLHRYFVSKTIPAELQTDERGRVRLGRLEGVTAVTLAAEGCAPFEWRPQRGACAYPDALHGTEGETLRVAVPDPAPAASLLEMRRGQIVRDWSDALAVKDRFLELRGLPAGDYSLWLQGDGREIAVRVTRGAARDGYAFSPRRALELPRLAPLNVAAVTDGRDAVEIRLANATPFARVHLFATRYLPAYDLFGRLGGSGASGLLNQSWLPAVTLYESGRDIGDEYRYILDRQQARKYPGNMLERPGLLLNPWTLRATDARPEKLDRGRDYVGQSVTAAQADSKLPGARFEDVFRPPAEGYASVDFLKQPAVTLLNLVPDKDGKVVVPRAELKGLPCLRVLAVDPTATVLACAALADTPVETRDLRLAEGLGTAQAYAEQKRVTALQAGESLSVGDVTTARTETYDTVAKIHRLFATLNPDATWAEFTFVTEWPGLDAAEKNRRYSKYACHELNFFLYHKDPRFFESRVAPALKNKKDKTFMDRWLLGDDLRGYLEPWRFARLNAAERALLGRRVRGQAASLARDARDRADLLPPDMEAFNRRFDTALQTGALEADASRLLPAPAGINELKEEVAFEYAAEKKPRGKAPAARGVVIQAMRSAEEGVRASSVKETAAAYDVSGALMESSKEPDFLEARLSDRETQRRFFQKLDKTQEWAENNYWQLPIEKQIAGLIEANAFWADYAAHDGQTPFLSKAFAEATSNFTEMMLALAVMNVPFSAAPHEEKVEGVRYTLKAGSPLVMFHREIRETQRSAGGMLVAEAFFRADDRERFENNERFDKLVTDEFLPQVVYGAQVVITNPTGDRRKLNALLQIPVGAIPVSGGFYTKGHYLVLEPYSTRKIEYFFYFPAVGRYPHTPVTVAQDDREVGTAAPFTFNVVAKLSKADTASWAWLSQNGSDGEVAAYLEAANLYRTDLDEIAWRMKDEAVFKKIVGLLDARHVYSDTLWSYGIRHNDPAAVREYLRRSSFAGRCGLWLESPLLTLDPVERFDFQHLEYAPLVNPRAHRVGAKRTILNAAFLQQYQRFLKVLSYKPQLTAEDRLTAATYMMLQDRVEEALVWFGRVDRAAVAEALQYDYLGAYLAFYRGDTAAARELAERHADEPLELWRNRFAQVLTQLGEAEGTARPRDPAAADGAGVEGSPFLRDQAQGALAVTEPALEMAVEAGRIRLDTRNVAEVTLNFYPMDIELLFSRNPFLQEGAAQFSFIRPVASRTVAVPAGQTGVAVELPPEFKTKNVMVEALAGGVRKTQACYANALNVHLIENYGQLVVTQSESGKPLPGVYVKVYARLTGGEVKFIKDGYTDLRGRFDTVSLNTDEAEKAERLSVLVLSDAFGALVRETPPPKR